MTSNPNPHGNRNTGRPKYKAIAPLFPSNQRPRRFRAVDVEAQAPNLTQHIVSRPQVKGQDIYGSNSAPGYANFDFLSDKNGSSSSSQQSTSNGKDEFDFSSLLGGKNSKQLSLQQDLPEDMIPDSFAYSSVVTQQTEEDSFKKPRTMPRLIGPYNEYTSFTSDCEPEKLWNSLTEIIKKQVEIDFDFGERQFKVRGRKWLNHMMTEFQIHFFQKDKVIVVEFQKRSGDPWVFSEFLQTVLNALNREGLVTNTKCFLEPLSDKKEQDEEDVEIAEAGETVLNSVDESTAMSVTSDDDFNMLELEPDDFLNPSSSKNAVDFDEDFAKEIWDMLVGKDTYHELRKHAAITIAQACSSDSGRAAFKKVEKNYLSCLLEQASKCFDAQIVRCLCDAVYNLVNSKEYKCDWNVDSDQKLLGNIQRRWLSGEQRVMQSTEIGRKVTDIMRAVAVSA